MTKLSEKIGYGFGDMSSSMFWKIFSYYLPFFYSNIYGLSLADTGFLLLISRIWDAVSDPMMGIIADRTKTRWGKYRPYLLWVAAPFAICGILLFTTPAWGYTGKLIWAYATYILMMTVYTAINVPYGAMLGVMTDNSDTKTVLSSYRMFFAYIGSFIALYFWEPICKFFVNNFSASISGSWQYSMIVIASICFVLFILCFRLTREHLKTVSTKSIGSDFKSLLSNKPWWLLIGAVLCSNFSNTLRGATAAYFFKDYIPEGSELFLGPWSFIFFTGLFLGVGEIANMLGVALAVPLSRKFGKKTTYIATMSAFAALSIAFFFPPLTHLGMWTMFILQILISICTGIISPLVWSMYADVSDYVELRDGTASTGLIFSSSSMAQKFGTAFGGSAAMWILAAFGYNTAEGAMQTGEAITGIKILMSWGPAIIAIISLSIIYFYPLTTKRMYDINEKLKVVRKNTMVN